MLGLLAVHGVGRREEADLEAIGLAAPHRGIRGNERQGLRPRLQRVAFVGSDPHQWPLGEAGGQPAQGTPPRPSPATPSVLAEKNIGRPPTRWCLKPADAGCAKPCRPHRAPLAHSVVISKSS